MTRRVLALLQGAYYVLTGVWPLVSMETFEKVTGPKTDDWLVHTVGVLVIVVGLVLLFAAVEGLITGPLLLLGAASAAGLAALEFFYVLRGVIWPIYMLDAVGEVVLIALWATALFRDRRGTAPGSTTPATPAWNRIHPIR